jgi:hypothetical protein
MYDQSDSHGTVMFDSYLRGVLRETFADLVRPALGPARELRASTGWKIQFRT